MPRIDDIKVQEKVFKKKEYRSWDGNLLEKLKLTENTSPVSSSKEKSEATQEQEKQCAPIRDVSKKEEEGSNQGSNKVQLEPNQGSNEAQAGRNQGSNGGRLELNQSPTEPQSNPNIKVQLGFVSDRLLAQKLIARLGGNEKKIFFYILNICSIKGSLSTGEIIGKDLTNAISTTRNGRETAIKRLSKKGLLKREKGKTGANGTLSLYINELIKTEALSYLNTYTSEKALLSNWSSSRVQQNNVHGVQLEPHVNIHSISNINNTNTKNANLPENWLEINFDALKGIGFSTTQLKQLHTKSLNTPEIIQESINHFSFGLENTSKVQKYQEDGKALNVLMGVLRQGGNWFEAKYEPPKDKALREFVERQKAQKSKREKAVNDLMEIEFEDWKNRLTEEEIKAIVPSDRMSIHAAKISALIEYYKNTVLLPRLRCEGLL